MMPQVLADILAGADPDTVFHALLPALGEDLQCDRCFLYLRHPQFQLGRVPYCWRRNPDIPLVFDPHWKPEPGNLVEEDPMFAAAVRAEPSIFVEDVETASPEVVNRTFEQENFGHRALIHSHLRWNGELWGVLQPCVFDQPRLWTEGDRATIARLEPEVTQWAIAYVQAAKDRNFSP